MSLALMYFKPVRRYGYRCENWLFFQDFNPHTVYWNIEESGLNYPAVSAEIAKFYYCICLDKNFEVLPRNSWFAKRFIAPDIPTHFFDVQSGARITGFKWTSQKYYLDSQVKVWISWPNLAALNKLLKWYELNFI